MQSFRNEERNRSTISPYARRKSLTPYLFAGRNFDSPRGRIHSPGDNRRESDYRRKMESSGVENVNPVGYRCVDAGEMNIGREFGKISNRENNFLRNFEDFKPKLPVQLIGNLSLAESNGMGPRIPHSGNGKGGNFAREIEPGQSQNQKTKSFNEENQIKRREYQLRLLTGSVEKVLQWFKFKNHFNLLFEVIAGLIDVRPGKFPTEKCLLLRDENTGPTLLATFYEIDRPLPVLVVGSAVRCIGRMTSRNSLQAFRVEQISDEEKAHSQRLLFMSNLVAEEVKSMFNKK